MIRSVLHQIAREGWTHRYNTVDWKNLTALPLRAFDRQEKNLSSMAADLFQSLIPEHNLVGFVVGTDFQISLIHER
ncbi:hypothetical protein QYF36_002755 [Acer negundo]|nr:hypothetical protein QYF36_002755 [Acer negundo]